METEWSVAAGEQDPILVVPWQDPQGDCAYRDLLSDPSLIDELPEASAWPEMRSALLQLNTADAWLSTAKCDVWELSDDEKQLDFGSVASGWGAYFDILARSSPAFTSMDIQIACAISLADAAASLPPQDAAAHFIVRPAHRYGQDGYSITAYVYGYGETASEARENWAAALRAIVHLLLASRVSLDGRIQTIE